MDSSSGSNPSSNPLTSFSFGSQANQPQSGTQPSSSGVNPALSAFSFGAKPSTNPSFGSGSSQTPFGGVGSQSPFGTSNQPAFGASGSAFGATGSAFGSGATFGSSPFGSAGTGGHSASTFGATSSSASASGTTGSAFGTPFGTAGASQATSGGFTFNAPSATPASGGFTFNAPSTTPSASGFSFNAPSTAATGGFTFGAPSPAQGQPSGVAPGPEVKPSFGAPLDAGKAPAFSSGSSWSTDAAKPTSSFQPTSLSQPTAPAFAVPAASSQNIPPFQAVSTSFQASVPSQPTQTAAAPSTSGFSFTAPKPETAPSLSGFSFDSAKATATSTSLEPIKPAAPLADVKSAVPSVEAPKFTFAKPEGAAFPVPTSSTKPEPGKTELAEKTTPLDAKEKSGAVSAFQLDTKVGAKSPTKPESSFVPSVIKSKTLQEIATKFSMDMENQLKTFKSQAITLVANDFKIISNGSEISALITQCNELGALSKDVTHQLAFVKNQHSELENILNVLEESLSSLEATNVPYVGGPSADYLSNEYSYADQNRTEIFRCAAQIGEEFDRTQNYLLRCKTSLAPQAQTDGSFVEILDVLNNHMQSFVLVNEALKELDEKSKRVSAAVSCLESTTAKIAY